MAFVLTCIIYYVQDSSKRTFGKGDEVKEEVMEEVQIHGERSSLTDFITRMYNSFTGLQSLSMLGLSREKLKVVESF